MQNEKMSEYQYGLYFDVKRSIMYHDKRNLFYFNLIFFFIFLVVIVICVSTMIFNGKNNQDIFLLLLFHAVTVGVGIILSSIIFRKANKHKMLAEKFKDIEFDMVMSDVNNEGKWIDFEVRRLIIERNEPHIYKMLDAVCRNQLLIAEGYDVVKDREVFIKISPWQRLTCNIFHYTNTVIEKC